MCNDKALLEDAIQHAANFCQRDNENKIKNFIILLCNSICVRSNDILKGLNYLNKSNKFDTITTISKFNNFSPVRAKKIIGQKLLNYIPNKKLKEFTPLLVIETEVSPTIALNLYSFNKSLKKYEDEPIFN